MKILIEVKTPGNGKTYELMVDDKMTVGLAKEKIIEQVLAFENGCIAFGEGAELFAASSRTYLPDNLSLRRAGLRGGQMVMLL